MKSYPMRARARKPFRLPENQPDLFEWPASRPSPEIESAPRVVRKVATCFRLPFHHARLVAELAGFRMEVGNNG